MNIVLKNKSDNNKIKHRILNEFLIYAYANQQYMPEVEKRYVILTLILRKYERNGSTTKTRKTGRNHSFYEIANEKKYYDRY
jgi:hypothetical protein